jgi:hypothetical protein
MSVPSAMIFTRLAILFFVAGCPFAAFFARLYPAYVVPIVLAAALIVSVPPGLLLVRAMRRGREDGIAARYRRSERGFFLAAAVSQLGLMLSSPGRGPIGALGVAISAGGMFAACWLLLKVAAVESRRDRWLAPVDPGRRLD